MCASQLPLFSHLHALEITLFSPDLWSFTFQCVSLNQSVEEHYRLSCCHSSSCNWEQMWRGRVFNWGCQAEGRICWAPRDLLISLHFNCLKNELCTFCKSYLRCELTVTSAWLFSPIRCVLLQSQEVIKDGWKNKFPNVPAPCIHTYGFCLSRHHTLFHSENKSRRHHQMRFFLSFFCLLEHSPVRHHNISIDFLFPSYVLVLF